MNVLDIPQTSQEWMDELNLIIQRGRGLDWTIPTNRFFGNFNLSYGPSLEQWKDLEWYGPLEPFLRDPRLNVSDVLVNGSHQEMVIVSQGRRQQTGIKIHQSWIELLQQQMLLQSGLVTPETVEDWPALVGHPHPAHMVVGCVNRSIRFGITRSPATPAGPTLSLRILPDKWPYLDELVSSAVISREAADMLLESLRRGVSIIIAGMTGSGKTTLTTALLQHIGQEKRIVVLEEAAELPDFTDSIHIEVLRSGLSFAECVYFTLRQKPDLVVVGEVRGNEAMALIRAAATGHPGVATIHAANTQTALKNLERMACEEGNVPPTMIRQSISDINNPFLIVHIGRYGGRRMVGAIDEIRPVGSGSGSGDNYPLQHLFGFDAERNALVRTGWVQGDWGRNDL